MVPVSLLSREVRLRLKWSSIWNRVTRSCLHFGTPLLLAVLLGLQHSLAMLAGIITPPLIQSGQGGGVNLPEDLQQYLVSTSLIVSGILSVIQITRFRIWRTP